MRKKYSGRDLEGMLLRVNDIKGVAQIDVNGGGFELNNEVDGIEVEIYVNLDDHGANFINHIATEHFKILGDENPEEETITLDDLADINGKGQSLYHMYAIDDEDYLILCQTLENLLSKYQG